MADARCASSPGAIGPLARGQVAPLLVQVGVVAVGQRVDEPVDERRPRGLQALLVAARSHGLSTVGMLGAQLFGGREQAHRPARRAEIQSDLGQPFQRAGNRALPGRQHDQI